MKVLPFYFRILTTGHIPTKWYRCLLHFSSILLFELNGTQHTRSFCAKMPTLSMICALFITHTYQEIDCCCLCKKSTPTMVVAIHRQWESSEYATS